MFVLNNLIFEYFYLKNILKLKKTLKKKKKLFLI